MLLSECDTLSDNIQSKCLSHATLMVHNMQCMTCALLNMLVVTAVS